MLRKIVLGIVLRLLLTSILVFNIQSVEASGTIYIRADGSIDPPAAPIQQDGDMYTFTDNISYSRIIVERENIVVDGTGYVLEGSEIRIWFKEVTNNVTIRNMNMTSSGGIYLHNSTDCVISGNTLMEGGTYGGITLSFSRNNTVINNRIIKPKNAGIWLDSESSNNSILENTIVNGRNYGIYIRGGYNILRNNNMTGNRANFGVSKHRYQSGNYLSYFLNDIDKSNTVNGKSIYYLVNQKNVTIDSSSDTSIGYLGFVNCTNIKIRGLNIKDNAQGVLFAYTTNSIIRDNTFSSNIYGLSMYYSAFITLIDNTMVNNAHGINIWNSWGDVPSGHHTIRNNLIAENTYGGINVWYSLGNGIIENTISNNTWYTDPYHFPDYGGITLKFSNGGNVTHNTLTNNSVGIYNYWSTDFVVKENQIRNNMWGLYLEKFSIRSTYYHNSFLHNTEQVYVHENFNDVWDDGYPSGGNYWSDYTGIDSCSGPFQNETGSDGMGDTPYVIDANNQDNYPLMHPWGYSELTVNSTPIRGIQFTVDGKNRTTPYTEWLPEGSYTLKMPQIHNGYIWSHWLEDRDTNRIKTIILPGTTWTAVYKPKGPPVGGEWIPIDKYELLAPWVILVSFLMISTVPVSALYRKYGRRKKNE